MEVDSETFEAFESDDFLKAVLGDMRDMRPDSAGGGSDGADAGYLHLLRRRVQTASCELR